MRYFKNIESETVTNQTKKIMKIGQTLETRYICDSNAILTATVKSFTAKTVTIECEGQIKRCKIHEHNGEKFIFPQGQYSMAPKFRI